MAPGCRTRASATRIDHPLGRDRCQPAGAELRIEEAEIEAGIVRDQRRIADEFEQLVGTLVRNSGLSERNASDRPCTASASAGIDALGIEIGVEGAAGLHPVDHLDAADLDQPVAALRDRGRWFRCRR